jgi:futalosine hydrolase
MTCLVAAATILEFSPFLEYWKANDINPKSDSVDIDFLVTGVGLSAATYSLARQVGLKRPDLIIQAGIAGSFDPGLQLGSVLVIEKDQIADQGVIENDRLNTIFDLGLANQDQHPYTKGWLQNKSAILDKISLKKVTGISVNEITTAPVKIKLYQDRFNPVIESMEGAALHYVCLMEGIPFIQLRAVSNYISERDKKNWKIKESIANLNNELIHLFETL